MDVSYVLDAQLVYRVHPRLALQREAQLSIQVSVLFRVFLIIFRVSCCFMKLVTFFALEKLLCVCKAVVVYTCRKFVRTHKIFKTQSGRCCH